MYRRPFILFTVTGLFTTVGAYAADPQAEALRQEVVTAVQKGAPLRAELTLITSHTEYRSEPRTSGRPRRTGWGSTPHQVRRKTQFEVVSGLEVAALASLQAPGDKARLDVDPVTLAYVGDPFLSNFRQGFPAPTDPIVYVQNVHYVGLENKDGVDYRVLQADKLIVTAPAASGEEARARVVVTDWKWYVGPDGLIHRLTWEDHEGHNGNESTQKDEVIVNAFTKG